MNPAIIGKQKPNNKWTHKISCKITSHDEKNISYSIEIKKNWNQQSNENHNLSPINS
jgi:hypothetical protein